MDLEQYLSRPDAESMAEFARRLGLNPDQIRQWRHRQDNRRPSPKNCVEIERATRGLIRRQDLREDWADIWPELIGSGDREGGNARHSTAG